MRTKLRAIPLGTANSGAILGMWLVVVCVCLQGRPQIDTWEGQEKGEVTPPASATVYTYKIKQYRDGYVALICEELNILSTKIFSSLHVA